MYSIHIFVCGMCVCVGFFICLVCMHLFSNLPLYKSQTHLWAVASKGCDLQRTSGAVQGPRGQDLEHAERGEVDRVGTKKKGKVPCQCANATFHTLYRATAIWRAKGW